jgi:hypothetical protein
MSPKTTLLIKIAIAGILILLTIGVLGYLVKHESRANKPFKATVTQFKAADAEARFFGAKITVAATRHSRLVGIVIDKEGAFTETEKELLGRSIIRFSLGRNLVTPVGTPTPNGALELRLPVLHFLEVGDEVTLGFLTVTSCTPELVQKNAKVTFDLLGIIIRDDQNRLVATDPRQFPKFLTVSCETAI